MAYTTIDKPTDYFNTVTWTGDGSSSRNITGVGFQPDWVWGKCRNATVSHALYDSVRGGSKLINSNAASAEGTNAALSAFVSDGFSVNSDSYFNANSNTYVAWNWLAGGTAPAITYSVKVVSDSGNKYRFDDFGTSAVTLDLQEGGTYTFDQSDSSNSGHPLRFSTTSNGTHGGGSEYTTGVTTTGTPGSSGAKTVITVAASAPTLYYYCTQHSAMGGQANTNSTFGSSNFSGSIQANVSANTTAGFSIVSWTGTGANATVGHGLGVAPKMIILKNRSAVASWLCYHSGLTSASYYINLNKNSAQTLESTVWNSTTPTSNVFSLGSESSANGNANSLIAYCFAEKKGYSKFGSYTGNGSSDGSYIHLGFKPAFVMIKRTGGTQDWIILDNKRPGYNETNRALYPNATYDDTSTDKAIDTLSNGFKLRKNHEAINYSENYIYMAFAESPFVTGASGIPTTAR